MSNRTRITRRRFIRGALGAAAAPYVITSSALGGNGRSPASERITVGHIGIGGQGGGHLRAHLGRGDLQVVAVCDVDGGHLERAKATAGQGVLATKDFREVVARDDIDAVLIATPDHWHGLIAIAAAKAGKDIYCEKPLVATIAEGKALVEAVRRYGTVFQTGSQERSNGRCRQACELVRNGRIGKLRRVTMNLPTDNRRCGPQAPAPVPEGFDYDMWLGPAPWEPYTRLRCHFNFRWIRDYSDGELTDRGAHVCDIALWGAGVERSGPVEIEGTGVFPEDGLWNTAVAYDIRGRWSNGVEFVVTSKGERGIRFEGTDGWIFVAIHGGALSAEPASVLKSTIGPDEIHLYRSPGHRENWLECVRARREPIASAEIGHRSVSFCHLCQIAILTGRKLTWDPVKEQFVGDDAANRMVSRRMRAPWRM